jgi:hypothetical protein
MDEFPFIKDFSFDGIEFDIDLKAFDLGENKTISENRYVKPKLFQSVKSHLVKYDNAEKLIDEIGDSILAGDRINALLSGNFIFGDIFEALAVKQNIYIDSLQISTLSLSKDNVDSLHNLLAGDYLGNLEIIVSDYFWSHNRQNAPYIYSQLDISDKFQMAVAGTHTKVALILIGGKKLVVSGSANLRSSRCVEEICIETNAELYDFHKEWQTEIITKYSTIKKAVRASALFDMLTNGVEDKKSWHQE